jgi:hypothetical protein
MNFCIRIVDLKTKKNKSTSSGSIKAGRQQKLVAVNAGGGGHKYD